MGIMDTFSRSSSRVTSSMRRFLLAVCFAVVLSMPSLVHAFAVSPAVIELSGARGELVETTVTIINTKTADQTFYLQAIKFAPREDSGEPQFIPYDEDHAGLPEWLSFESNRVNILAQSRVDVPVRIRIPDDAPSGGYYAAAVVSDAPFDIVATNGATVSAKMAVLILLTVEGETIESLALLDFVSPDGPLLTQPGFGYTYRVQNQGNVHVAPEGTIALRDVFGRLVAVSDANPTGSRVLPATTRSFAGEFGSEERMSFLDAVAQQMQSFAIGPVEATLELSYAEEGKVVSDPIRFWFFPWQLLLVVLLAVSALIAIHRTYLSLLRKKTKRSAS